MKTGAIFVSCGGSGVVVDEALADACASGHLYGAAVDTFTFEPIAPDSPLLSVARQPQANLVLTPHTAAGAAAANAVERSEDYDNFIRFLRGEELIGRLV
jgi:phosphoglycerate dehydrogenase-like enzyme